LCGDQTGNNFERLLGAVGWKREVVFITNAVLCNPREETGNNATPSQEEIANCTYYLDMTIQLIEPAVVVSLGAVALRALESVWPHKLNLSEAVGDPTPWAGRLLVPLYHPGPRALVHRGFAKQTSDFMRLAKLIDPNQGLVRSRRPTRHKITRELPDYISPLQNVVCLIVHNLGKVTYFQLTKLLYLLDLMAIQRLGHALTGEIYLRQPEGPWPPAMQKQLPPLDGWELRISFRGRIPVVEPGPCSRFQASVDDQSLALIAEVLNEYGRLSNAQIKTVVYKTDPMRYLLGQERKGRDIRRVPVIYKDKCAPDTDRTSR
jgi:uracil-DNA glycosylase family 4